MKGMGTGDCYKSMKQYIKRAEKETRVKNINLLLV